MKAVVTGGSSGIGYSIAKYLEKILIINFGWLILINL